MTASLQQRESKFIFILLLLFLALLGVLADRILQAPFWSFNGTRLAPSFGLVHGYRLYYPPADGPVLSTIYGPVTALVYLAATLASSPNPAVLIGSGITVLFCFVPVAWLHLGKGRWRCAEHPTHWLALAACGLMMVDTEALRYSCINPHADGIGLGLGAAACICLYYGRGKGHSLALPISALLAVLSFWAKQTFLPLPFALALYVLLADGRGIFLQYASWGMLWSVVTAVGFFSKFGFWPVWFNLVVVPAGQVLHFSAKTFPMIEAFRQLIREGFPFLIPLLTYALYALVRFGYDWRELRPWLRRNNWAMLAIVGLALTPASVMGRAKIGGDINSLSFALYFYCIACTMMLARVATDMEHVALATFRSLARAFLVAIAIVMALAQGEVAFGIVHTIRSLRTSEQQVVFEYLLDHPNTVYFPMFPLSHLLAEGKLYHDKTGLLDREFAGYPLSPEHLRSYVPPGMEYIAFGQEGALWVKGRNMMVYFPEFRTETSLPELAGWTIYTNQASVGSR